MHRTSSVKCGLSRLRVSILIFQLGKDRTLSPMPWSTAEPKALKLTAVATATWVASESQVWKVYPPLPGRGSPQPLTLRKENSTVKKYGGSD